MKHDSFNESTEMYLKTVSELAVNNGPVSISALAARLGVSNVSATEMVHRLEERDLLIHTPYKGVSLTAVGRQQAAAVIRSHRLWERLLVDKLGLPWEKTHDWACQLEHATDTAVTEALAAFLNHPATCPHGNPIPDAAGALTTAVDRPLTDCIEGDAGMISRIYPESDVLLAYLGKRGIKPGTAVTITEIAPFNGPIIIACCEGAHAIGHEMAAHIFIAA